MTIGQDYAETIALKALAWLAGDPDVMAQFLAASGLAPAEISARAGEPEFLGAVLDFILMDDGWVQGFCDNTGLAYDQPMAARMALPGGAQLHWT